MAGYLQSTMATRSLLWLSAVYYDYTYSLPLVLPTLYAYLIFIITTSVLLSLHYLLSLPILLSAIHMYSMTMTTYSCYVSLVFDVAIPSLLLLPSHMS